MPKSSLTIQYATVSHLEDIVAFQLAMAQESEGLALDESTLRQGIQAVLSDPSKGHYWLASQAEGSVGMCLVTREWSDWRNAPYWWLQSVYVSPEARGTGVFRALVEAVESAAREAGVSEVRLYVANENTSAQAVYSGLGFTSGHYQLYQKGLG